MRTDQEIRDALHGELRPEPPLRADWPTFERRVRRARLARGATSVVAAAILAAGLIGALRLTRDDPTGFVTGAEGLLVDRVAGFRLSHPSGWVQRRGTVSGLGDMTFIVPRSEGGSDTTPIDRVRFAIGIRVESPRGYWEVVGARRRSLLELYAPPGADLSTTETEVGGRRALRIELSTGPGTSQYRPAVPRCDGCHEVAYVVDWAEGWVLDLSFVARDPTAFARHATVADRILRGLTRLEGSALQRFHGIARSSVSLDEPTREVVGFLEARAGGAGAEDWLTEAARKDYEHPPLGLYGSEQLRKYSILWAVSVGNDWVFEVEFKPPGRAVAYEQLVLSAGGAMSGAKKTWLVTTARAYRPAGGRASPSFIVNREFFLPWSREQIGQTNPSASAEYQPQPGRARPS